MKLIILDRDGVINKESADYVRSPQEWIPIPGSLEAIATLTKAGYTIAVATNQSGIGRGYFTLDVLDEIHDTLLTNVTSHGGKICKIYYCPHSPLDDCECRKPRIGLILQLVADFNLTLSQFADLQPIFIGDSLRDVELGLATGCRVFLVTSLDSHGATTVTKLAATQKQQITIVTDLAEATRRILA